MNFKLRKTMPTTRRSPLTYQRAATSSKPPVPNRPKNKQKILNQIIDRLLLLALGFIFLYGLFCRSAPLLNVNSSIYHTVSVYQTYANSLTRGLSYKTKISYNQKAVAEKLQKKFPEINQASISLPLLSQRVKIHLRISAPAFVLESGTSRYLLDDSGRLVAQTASAADGLAVIKDQSGLALKAGNQVLSPDNVTFISQVASQLKRAGVPIAYISLPPLPQEFELYTTDKPYYTKFYLGGDALVESGQFLAARHQFSQNHQDPSQYLDVRVSGKIFYK